MDRPTVTVLERERDWWKARATSNRKRLDKIKAALAEHADCWPDCPCVDLATQIKAALR